MENEGKKKCFYESHTAGKNIQYCDWGCIREQLMYLEAYVSETSLKKIMLSSDKTLYSMAN